MALGEWANKERSKEIMEILTRECRDLLDVVEAPGDRNEIIRNHFELDMSGYGISVEEYLVGLTPEDRREVVNRVLASPEYNGESVVAASATT